MTRAACACKLIDRPLLQLLHKVCVLECLRDVPFSRLPMCEHSCCALKLLHEGAGAQCPHLLVLSVLADSAEQLPSAAVCGLPLIHNVNGNG